MAPGGGAVQLLEPLTRAEVRHALEKAGFKDKRMLDLDFIGGSGGFGTVIGVGIFSAIGGMLFGLDIGYIAGVESMDSFLNDLFPGKTKLDDTTEGIITGVFALGAVVAAFPSLLSRLVDAVGRSGAITAGAAVFCAGAACQGLATSVAMMLAGRFIAGASVGLLSANIPIYQGEIAPPAYRGTIVSLYQLAITTGIMVAFWISKLLENVNHGWWGGWRYTILIQLGPGLFLAIGGLFMPQSPRWLVSKGRCEEAFETLQRVRGPEDDVSMELAQIFLEYDREMGHGRPSWGEFFSGTNARLLAIGVLLQMMQQLCGLNMFMYYGPKIFENIFNDKSAAFLFSAVTGVVNFLATFLAIAFVDRAGRMKLLMLSFLGMAVCCITLGVVGVQCLPSKFDDASKGQLRCGDWSKWVASGSIFFFILNFAYGCGPVVWVYCAEIFSLKYRTKANGLTTCANWVGNFVIGLTPPILLGTFGWNTMWIFAFVNVVGVVTCCVLPETKGRPLEEIQSMFEGFFGLEGSGSLDFPSARDCDTSLAESPGGVRTATA